MSDIVKQILAVILPVLYLLLVDRYPDFPLPQESFVNLVFWLLGLLFSGWQAEKMVSKYFRLR